MDVVQAGESRVRAIFESDRYCEQGGEHGDVRSYSYRMSDSDIPSSSGVSSSLDNED